MTMQMSKKKFWLIVVAVFFLGGMIGASGEETHVAGESVTNEVVKEVKVEDRERLNKLRTVDDKLIGQATEVMDAQSTVIGLMSDVLSRIDTISIDEVNAATQEVYAQRDRVDAATNQIDSLKQERERILTN